MQVNYNEISKTYDQVRAENRDVIDLFIDEVRISDQSKVLDL